MHRAVLRVASALLVTLLASLQTRASARDLVSLMPSTRWIMLSSPLFLHSHDKCNTLAQEFSGVNGALSEQHEACLDGAPSDEGGSGGTCSKASCQFLHTTRDKASRRSTEETSACRQKVNAYLAEERETARRRQQAAAE